MRHPLLSALALVVLSLAIPAAGQNVTSFSLSPSTVQGGTATTATVNLSGPAPSGGLILRLASLDPTVPMGPETVVVDGGQRVASFPLTVFPVDATRTVNITAATVGGTTTASALTVTPGPPWRTRIAVYRPGNAFWFIRRDGGATTPVQFGSPGDVSVPADYLGYGDDPGAIGSSQLAVFRPIFGRWFISSQSGTIEVPWGQAGDIPVPADYFGLGRAQVAIFRPGTRQWWIRTDSGVPVIEEFGEAGDIPVPGDYLGLGRAQLAVYRPSNQEWSIRHDGGEYTKINFGESGDQPVPADYFGVGRLQIATFRVGTRQWFIRNDDGTFRTIDFPVPGTVAKPGDYLGIGHAQMAVYQPFTGDWFIRMDSGSPIQVQYGGIGDVAEPSAYSSLVVP